MQPITLDEATKKERALRGRNNYGVFTNWLVELRPTLHPEISVVEIVQARCFDEAVWNAFFTRNIANTWVVTEVEEVDA